MKEHASSKEEEMNVKQEQEEPPAAELKAEKEAAARKAADEAVAKEAALKKKAADEEAALKKKAADEEAAARKAAEEFSARAPAVAEKMGLDSESAKDLLETANQAFAEPEKAENAVSRLQKAGFNPQGGPAGKTEVITATGEVKADEAAADEAAK